MKILLACGFISSLFYAAITACVPLQWPDYSSMSQTVSELSAIGAPTRALWVWLANGYTALIIAFGFGVQAVAGSNRALRNVAWLIIMYGALGVLWPLAPMHLRATLAAGGSTLTDTAHLLLGGATVLLMVTAIAAGAAAFGSRFRVYSFGTLMLLLIFGALTFLDAPRLAENLPTPFIGLWERINIGVFLLWICVLSAALLKRTERYA